VSAQPLTDAQDAPELSWPARDFGVRLQAAVAGRHEYASLEHRDGVRTPIDWRRWCSPPDAADRSVLARVRGVALDIGCGPGRLTIALAQRGYGVLGIDITPDAVRLTRAAGALALHRSAFAPIPHEGNWDTVLLVDGNIGIGGNPAALLRRVKELLASSGVALIEVEAPNTRSHVGPARIRHADGHMTSWFAWARVSVESIGAVAGLAGLVVRECWSVENRWFVAVGAAA
jgi:SAM-dependent methyltransferase